MLLEELNLLKDKKLKAISVFHPVKSYKGKKLGGGIFLSAKTFSDVEKSVVFYDTSKELKRNLSRIKTINSLEVNTRRKNVYDSSTYSLEVLTPFLKDCKNVITQLKVKIDKVDQEIKNKKLTKNKVLFFISEIKDKDKLPTTLIVNDNMVLSLLETNKIITYATPLSYVAWSSKKLKNNYKDFLRVGLVNHMKENLNVQKLDENNYNLYYRGVLIPGIRQLFFLNDFMDKI